MRKQFADDLYIRMAKDHRIVFITADLGYGIFDKVREAFPDRFVNTGAAEQAAMGMAVGMSLQGMIPVVYSITPFLLFRAAEVLRNYIDQEQVNVKLIGSGREDDYSHDGFSHYCGDDHKILGVFENILSSWPVNEVEMLHHVEAMFETDKPYYLNLKR